MNKLITRSRCHTLTVAGVLLALPWSVQAQPADGVETHATRNVEITQAASPPQIPQIPQTLQPVESLETLTPRQQFDRKLRKRNGLYRKLYRLNEQAAAEVKRGVQPFELHAQQQSAQDQINVLEQWLAILSSRHDWDVPEPPASPYAREVRERLTGAQGATANRDLAVSFGPDGVAHTDRVIKGQVLTLLAALNFHGYPQLSVEAQ